MFAMRALGAAAVVAAIAACYSPTPPAGAPCGTGGACPDGLVCSAGACVTSASTPQDSTPLDTAMIDATPIDARLIDGPPGDRDGDGVPDSLDNCPDVANANQDNEDGDKFGDACDPCPIDGNDDPTNPDGDDVADPCDPNPDLPGDHIVMFEGFHHGVPAAWTTVGNWSGSNDDVVTNGNGQAYLEPNVTIAGEGTFYAGITVTKATGTGGVQISLPFDPATKDSLDCNMYLEASGERDSVLYDDFSGGPLNGDDTEWVVNQFYVFALTHTTLGGSNGDVFCTQISGSDASVLTQIGGTPPAPITATAAAISGNLGFRVSWALMISSAQ
jgi:hypothetical protein